jgi:hypothetical protein
VPVTEFSAERVRGARVERRDRSLAFFLPF